MTDANGPKVSVILPFYNRADYVAKALDFVTNQTYRPIQLIAVDDGSSDETWSKLQEAKPSVETKGVEATFITKDNGGCASARNLAMQNVTGEYFAFLDDDDCWYPEKLERQMAEIQRTAAQGCCCTIMRVLNDGEKRKPMPPTPDRLLRGRCGHKFIDRSADAHLISLVVASELIDKVGEFDTTMRTWSDTEWIVRLLHRAEFCAVDDVLGEYIHNDQSLSRFEGFEALFKRDGYQEQALMLIKQHNQDSEHWVEAAWQRRVAQDFDEFIKHRLYAGELNDARAFYQRALQMTGRPDLFKKTRKKMRKARWLSLFGKTIRHPKFKKGEVITG